MTRKVKTERMCTRALISPGTFNAEKNTCDIVFATEAPYQRSGWRIGIDTPYNEVLSCKPGSCRMQRIEQGLPLFDNHPYDMKAAIQLGKVVDITFENGEAKGKMVFGARMDEAMKEDIKNGIISAISVGYQVHKLLEDPNAEGDYPTYIATDWEPLEVSLAPVPADPAASTKSEDKNVLTTINEKCMTIEEVKKNGSDEQKTRLAQIRYVTRNSHIEDEKIEEYFNSEKTVEDIEKECKSDKPETTQEKTIDEQITEAKRNAGKEELQKIEEIINAAKKADIPAEKAFGWYKEGKSLNEVYQLIIQEFKKNDPAIDNKAGVKATDMEKKLEGAEKALLHRACPSQFKDDNKNEFRSMSLIEMAKALARSKGVDLSMLSKTQIADRIFKREMSTSDFPLLLENVSNKMLRADYQGMPEYWAKVAREIPFTDFKEKSFYQIDSANGMKESKEGDEIKYGKMTESKQKAQIKKYAEGLLFTREAFINDDLAAFERIPSKFVNDWELLKGDIVWGIIINNKMFDNKAIFSSDNANLADIAGVVSDETLSAARAAMKSQTSISGKKIRVIPRFLIVSPDQETQAQKMLTIISAQTTANVNIWQGAFELICEPRFSGAPWYLAADPNTVDGLVYGYLDGVGLRSYREDDFNHDAIKFAVRGEFGAAMIDHRGWYKNAGK